MSRYQTSWDNMSLGLIVVGINCRRDQMSGIKCRGIKYRGIKCHQFEVLNYRLTME